MGGFVPSGDFDFLFFPIRGLGDNAPVEKTGAFNNPPMDDDPMAPNSNTLWWFGPPGLPAGGTAMFWLSINVPDGFFGANPDGITESAKFVLREHASIPGPATLSLLALSGLLATRRRH